MFKVRYFSKKPLFKASGMSIRGIGIREVMPKTYVQRFNGKEDHLFMVFHAPVQLGPLNSRQNFPSGTMMLWEPGSPQYYGNLTQAWSHSWIHCDGAEVVRALKKARAPLHSPIRLPDPSRIEGCLLNLHEELSGRFKPDPVIVSNTLINLIREAARSGDYPQRTPVTEGLAMAKEMMDSRYDEPLNLGDLAAVARLSPSHFCVEFRRCFGIPPIAYLIERRMRVAALLLSGTTDRVGEIGQRVGYPDPYYFSKHFKAVHGVSLSHLRS